MFGDNITGRFVLLRRAFELKFHTKFNKNTHKNWWFIVIILRAKGGESPFYFCFLDWAGLCGYVNFFFLRDLDLWRERWIEVTRERRRCDWKSLSLPARSLSLPARLCLLSSALWRCRSRMVLLSSPTPAFFIHWHISATTSTEQLSVRTMNYTWKYKGKLKICTRYCSWTSLGTPYF